MTTSVGSGAEICASTRGIELAKVTKVSNLLVEKDLSRGF